MPNYDPNYDYAAEPVATADDFEIADVQAPTKSAADIEAESSFEEIPPGTYELAVVGFLAAPKAERKEVFVDGQRAGYDTHSVVVKFGLPENPAAQVTDFFLLPPATSEGLDAYQRGSKKPDGKAAGFNSNKFFHFLERLRFTPEVDDAGNKYLPADARRLGNWKGRRIVATIVAGDPFTKKVKNTETGEEEEQTRAGRNQIKLFSYREAGTPVAGATQPTAMRAPGTPAGPNGIARAAGPQQQTAPAQVHAAQPARGPVAPPQAQRPAPQVTRPAPRPQPAVADRGLSNI